MITRARPGAHTYAEVVSKPWWRAVLRLTGLFVALGLVTSRVGLVVHELVGHGGTAVACGGDILDVQLFWFGGGWIRYDLGAPSHAAILAISLGGIAVELACGVALWWLSRVRPDGDPLRRKLVRGIAGALLVHAAWYFSTGTWHGYGDGVAVHRALGAWRYPSAIAVGLAACAIAYATSRRVLGALARTLPGPRGRRVAGFVLAAIVAGGFQAGLAIGEVRVRGDATYGAIMRPERERVAARELAAWQRAQAARGIAITEAEREAEARLLVARHREPPFTPFLLGLLAIAVIAGAARARDEAVEPISSRLLAIAGGLAAGSIGLVIAIDGWIY